MVMAHCDPRHYTGSVGQSLDEDFGPDEPGTTRPAPFSVTGPTSVEIERATRTGTASFSVLNTSGRPVRVRILPQPMSGADAAWLDVVGDVERPLGNAATLTADVMITVPMDVPVGQHAMRVDASPEDRPEVVAQGQAVAFTIPEPPEKKPRFPRWLLLAIIGAVLVLVLGGLAIWWFVLRSSAPEPLTAPEVSGDLIVGEVLTVTPGTWSDEEAPLVHIWQSCPGDAEGESPEGCTDVTSGSATAIGGTFTISAELEGQRIRVKESALSGDEENPDATDQFSGLTEVVGPPPTPQVTVPGLIDEPRSLAFEVLADLGLTVTLEEVGQSTECNPRVEVQDPGGGTEVDVGSSVRISTGRPRPWFECGFLTPLPFPEGVLLDLDDLVDPIIRDFRVPDELINP